jgi:hypothetical protein
MKLARYHMVGSIRLALMVLVVRSGLLFSP